MQSYFTTHTFLHDSEFQNFLLLQQCSENIHQNTVSVVSLLQDRNITGEGSHRHLLTSIKLLRHHQSQSKLVFIERLPSGVFADPFESFIIVFINAEVNINKFEKRFEVISLLKRLDTLGWSWRARLVPLLKTCTKPGTRTDKIGFVHCQITRSVVWEIPAGIRNHTEYVSVVTFVAAALSVFSIIVASVLSSKVESCKNAKQS